MSLSHFSVRLCPVLHCPVLRFRRRPAGITTGRPAGLAARSSQLIGDVQSALGRQQHYGRSDRTRRNHRRIWMTDAISHTPSTFALCLCGVVSTDSSTPAQKGQHVPAVYYLGVYTRMKIFPTFDLRYYWPAYQHIV